MNKSIILLALLALGFTGCASHYEITTTGSARYTCKGRPKRVDGWYVFKDATGREVRVSAMRVTSIEAVSPWHKTKDPLTSSGK